MVVLCSADHGDGGQKWPSSIAEMFLWKGLDPLSTGHFLTCITKGIKYEGNGHINLHQYSGF